MGMSGGKLDGEPMLDMNMTPLIDVLLVLLIMFIITIPIATHSMDIDLPSPPDNPPPPPPIKPIKNKLVITPEDELLWNGERIDEATLVTLLADSLKMEPEPELQFEPFGLASYDKSSRTLQIIKLSGVTKFGFVGNERYQRFGKEVAAE